ncbi:MAG: carboxymethylenebutenolidase [Alphaproteobacteria bacterium]|jgi:carboxymethylenebutenolidase|nr:carboxymethylenebutenolidase [Alphaproteobacteria bacterium]
MGEQRTIESTDGTQIGAYQAKPGSATAAGLVVIQEIFGVNRHIRNVTDRFAADGYLALAPAMFDRRQKNVQLGYTQEGIAQGRDIAMSLKPDEILADVRGAIKALRHQGCRKVGIVGFCFGGTVAWRAAASADVDAAVGYYGGGVYAARELKPKVPTALHFGDKDAHIPMDQVKAVADAHPEVEVHVYAADHGFHCDERASYDAAAAKQAYQRTLEFFGKHLK